MRPIGVAILVVAWAPGAAQDPCNGMTLVDVAREAGLQFDHERGASGAKHLPETMGAGLAWLDYDRDGRLDLYVVQSGPFPSDGSAGAANRLLRNRGDGTFVDVTEVSGAGHRGYGQGVTAADFDGDGLDDLYLSNFGPDALLRNRGDGTFVDATADAGLGLRGWSSSAAAADGDGDGDLDLYVTRYLEYEPPDGFFCVDAATGEPKYCDPTLFDGASDRYYRNLGDGTFEDATDGAGFAGARGKGLGVMFTDLDADGHPDIYVANDLTINLLFRNRGDGTFEDVSLFSGAGLNRQGQAEAGMGLAVGDVDGDGRPDLMVTNFDVETNTLYANRGAMQFEDVSAESDFGPPSFNLLGFGLVAADLNRDGALDVYAANGHIFETPARDSVHYEQPDLLLLGDGRGHFRAARCGPAFEHRGVGRGLAAADYDNDGDVDLALSNSGGALQLLRNDGSRGGWIGVSLIGAAGNTRAVGARVSMSRGDRRQVRWTMAGSSYQSSHDPRVLFGLGDPDAAASVTLDVAWPDGRQRRYEDLLPGRYWELRPDRAEARPLATDRGDTPVPGTGAPARSFPPRVGWFLLGLLGLLVAGILVRRLLA